jgi:hypothetical protein
MEVRLLVLRAGHPLAPGIFLGTHFCYRLSRPQGHSAAGRIRSIEKYGDLIGNRTRGLPACGTVPQLAKLYSSGGTTSHWQATFNASLTLDNEAYEARYAPSRSEHRDSEEKGISTSIDNRNFATQCVEVHFAARAFAVLDASTVFS